MLTTASERNAEDVALSLAAAEARKKIGLDQGDQFDTFFPSQIT